MLAPVPSRKGRPSELLQREAKGSDDLTGMATVGLNAVRQTSNGHATVICYNRLLKSTMKLKFSKKKLFIIV